MPTTYRDEWHSHHHRDTRDNVTQRSNQDDKHLKAFVGIVLFVVLGFALAGLHPLARTDSPDIQNSAHAFIRPAN